MNLFEFKILNLLILSVLLLVSYSFQIRPLLSLKQNRKYFEFKVTDVINMDKKLSSSLIDLRSDTVTLPSSAMRNAMAEAVVGDDVFEDDPTVKSLESRVANVIESFIYV
jgi:hypothetical protein